MYGKGMVGRAGLGGLAGASYNKPVRFSFSRRFPGCFRMTGCIRRITEKQDDVMSWVARYSSHLELGRAMPT
jgi:hypothetical protein